MFCPNCGKESTTEAIFCPSCGTSIGEELRSRNGQHSWTRRFPWILWGTWFVPLLMYIVVANVMGSDAGGFDEPFTLVKYVLYAIGAVLLGVAFVLRWAFHKWIRSAVLGDILVVLLPGSLCLAVGIYGLIIFITNNADFVSLYLLVGIAAVSLVFMRPSGEVG